MKGVIKMNMMSKYELFTSFGSVSYNFRCIDENIQKFCSEQNVRVLDAPSAEQAQHLVLSFDYAISYNDERLIIVHSYDLDTLSKEEQEFTIMHELGHIINNTGKEDIADTYAMSYLIRKYGRDRTRKICGELFIKIHQYDKEKDICKVIEKGYECREEYIRNYIKFKNAH